MRRNFGGASQTQWNWVSHPEITFEILKYGVDFDDIHCHTKCLRLCLISIHARHTRTLLCRILIKYQKVLGYIPTVTTDIVVDNNKNLSVF
jgi:hypothetical protein